MSNLPDEIEHLIQPVDAGGNISDERSKVAYNHGLLDATKALVRTPPMTVTRMITLLSMIVHADEYINSETSTPNGKTMDKIAFNALMADPLVQEVLGEYQRQSFLPARRDGVTYPHG